jgi:Rieske 2Fe-2S family protein
MTLLEKTEATLPSGWYYDPAHYARELKSIWYRDWVCVGRLEQIQQPGDYIVGAIGNQQLIVTRNQEGQARVFHNTCRHRGSALCASNQGRFRNGRIICPYHTWTYSLDGELLATPNRIETDDFRMQDFPLYEVHTDSWGGFLFINLSEKPRETLTEFLGAEARGLDNWPLADMVSVHQERTFLNCNWKVFWENYNECYHCPRLHPELCKVVPAYGKGVISPADDKAWQPADELDVGEARLADGYSTWTLDGKSTLPPIDGLSEADQDAGMIFASFAGSMFVVGHTDYVRSVRVLPTGPESIELIVDWLLMPGVRETHPGEIDRMLELGRLVVKQDGEICELNQQGLKSARHHHGVLVPQEYYLWEFHQWLRARLAE